MKQISLITFFMVYLSLSAFASEPGTMQPKEPTEKDKCPVCGMFVKEYTEWMAQIAFSDITYFFDGAKDMFRFYLDVPKYAPQKKAGDIKAIYVKDYYNVKFIDAAKAFYIIGSDVMGPMGKELIPFEKEADAQGFLKDHKGEKILQFKDITAETIKQLQ